MFRENTEDLYAGVEFNPVPPQARRHADEVSPAFKPFAACLGMRSLFLVSCKINTSTAPNASSTRRSLTARRRAQEGHRRPQGQCRAGHRRAVPRGGEGSRGALPRDHVRRSQRRRHHDVAAQNPMNYDVLVPQPLRRHRVGSLRAEWWAASASLLGQTSARSSPSSSPRTDPPRSTRQYKVNPIAHDFTAEMMLEWLGEQDLAAALERSHGGRHQTGTGPHLRHGRPNTRSRWRGHRAEL